MNVVVTKEKAVEVFGKEVVEIAESFYETDFEKHFWTDLDESEKRNYLLRGAVQIGISLEQFRFKYDNLRISLSPSEVAVWVEKLDQLQKEGGGEGIPYIESVVTYLRTDQPERAKMICFHEGDKIRSHPKILSFLKETLMKNEAWYRD